VLDGLVQVPFFSVLGEEAVVGARGRRLRDLGLCYLDDVLAVPGEALVPHRVRVAQVERCAVAHVSLRLLKIQFRLVDLKIWRIIFHRVGVY